MLARSLAVLLALGLSLETFAYTPGKTYKITVLHTNDSHGAFWKNQRDEYGMAARAALIERIRQEVAAQGGNVLLLDAGDVNTGTPESEMADAEPDFRAMSLMKYDVMTVGNHDFDKPFQTLLKQQREWASFPLLSANLYDSQTGKRFFSPYLEKKFDDLDVAILGLTTDQVPEESIRFPHDTFEARAPIAEAARIVPELRSHSDVLIALTHIGYYANEQHGSRSPGDVTLARQVPGIDLIVGGHSQTYLYQADYQNSTYIVQAGEWGKYLGRVDLEFKDGKVMLINYALIPVNLKNEQGALLGNLIPEDAGVLGLLAPFKDSAVRLNSTVVGTLSGKLEGTRAIIRSQETNLGNLMTYLMAANTGADVAVTDSGVIRNSILPGPVTYGDILSVLPPAFGLKFASVELSGRELWDFLAVVGKKTDGSYPQLHGLKLELRNNQLEKVSVRNRSSGAFEPLSLSMKYKLAVTDFIARGGDGYPVLTKHPSYVETDIVDSAALRKFFETRGTVDANEFAPIGNLIRSN